MLIDQRELRKRIDSTYNNMTHRAKPRKWKGGKKKGKVRVVGIDRLPFTRQQLWDHAVNQVGFGVTLCPYCREIGRNATPITLMNCVFDHVVPVKNGGSWELDNLRAICADCNTLKGHLSYPFFVGIMAAIEKWHDSRDRDAMYSNMRTHGVTQRLRFAPKGDAEAHPAKVEPEPLLPLKEDW